MTLHFLGTGDAFGSGGLDQTFFLLSLDNFNTLIDCGCSALTSLKRHSIQLKTIDAIMIATCMGIILEEFHFLSGMKRSVREKAITDYWPPATKERVELLSFSFFPGNKNFRSSFEIAYKTFDEQPISIPVVKLDKVISEFADKGFPVISSFNHPIAKIVFFDTYKEIRVMTEIMGITEEGEKAVQKMKSDNS
jgi:ribonuclease BN (tRNA processing enzyme)